MLLNALLLAALAAAPAVQPSPEPAPPIAEKAFSATLDTGVVSVITRGEKHEYAAARATVAGRLSSKLTAWNRLDIGGSQDGGALNLTQPTSFRTIEDGLGLSYSLGAISAVVISGATFSIEGDAGRPIDARLFTVAGGARIAIGDSGYVYAAAGHHGPVGGPALLVAASIPKGDGFITVDFALPFNRNVLEQKTWVLKLGASVRLKAVHF